MIQAVLFDLDGTLADTALNLGGALNTLFARHNLPAKSMDEIRTQASHGAAGLLKLKSEMRFTDIEYTKDEFPPQYQRENPLCGYRRFASFFRSD